MDIYNAPTSFYTISSNQTDDQSFDSTNMTSPLPTPSTATHDTSRSDYHLKDFSEFVKALDQSAQRAFPNLNRSRSRYTSIQVLLLRWEQDELNVEPELADLRRVFEKYRFNIETWCIPTKNAHRRLMLKAGEFVDKHESKECLMIVYYGGHAFINDARQSTWACTRSRQNSLVDWSAVQTLFESAISDVLLLLDCCAAASSAPKGGTALTETIAACGWESIAAEPGRFSFTTALIEVLEEWVNRTFSVAMLHSKILSVLKHERPELLGGTRRVECRRTPVYIVTTENPEAVSIMLSRMPLETRTDDGPISSKRGRDHLPKSEKVDRGDQRRASKRRKKSSLPDPPSGLNEDSERTKIQTMFSSASAAEDTVKTAAPGPVASPTDEYAVETLHAETPEGKLRLPHVLISVALVEGQVLNIKAFSDWLASFPALARYASVQSAYQSYSTLLIVSLPVVVWDLLPASLACNFIGYVQSTDMLAKRSREEIPSVLNKEALKSTTPKQQVPIWKNQQSKPENEGFQTLQRHSRTPSAASVRSMSPTSGNAMRLPVDRSSQFQTDLTTLQKKATPASTQNFAMTSASTSSPPILTYGADVLMDFVLYPPSIQDRYAASYNHESPPRPQGRENLSQPGPSQASSQPQASTSSYQDNDPAAALRTQLTRLETVHQLTRLETVHQSPSYSPSLPKGYATASPPWSPAAQPTDLETHKRRISDITGVRAREYPLDRDYSDKLQEDLRKIEEGKEDEVTEGEERGKRRSKRARKGTKGGMSSSTWTKKGRKDSNDRGHPLGGNGTDQLAEPF